MEGAPRVFWDGYGLDEPNSGVFVHARRLAEGLAVLGVRPTVIGTPRAVVNFPELDGLVQAKLPKPLWPLATNRKALKAAQRERHIVHGLSNFNIPYFSRPKNQTRVLTVHDIVPLLAPEGVSRLLALQLKALMGPAVGAADRIVCVSRWTEKTLTERFPAARGRTIVIPNGIPGASTFATRKVEPEGATRLLTVARFEPYKRLDYLVFVLRSLPTEVSADLATNPRGRTWAQATAPDLIDAGRLRVHVGLLDEDLGGLYRRADVLVHPSMFEGFCLPAVEAMAAGCAVVYQTGSAMDEILGPAVAVGLPPSAPLDQWVQAVRQAAEMPRSTGWESRIGAHYATLATWKDAALSLQKLYTGS